MGTLTRGWSIFHVNVAKGDAVLFLGSLYHAASANRTSQDRVAGYFFMTKSYLKPEENLHLGTDLRVFKNDIGSLATVGARN